MKKDFKKALERLRDAARNPLTVPGMKPGDVQEGGSIYLGRHMSAGLEKTFNVFAAPKDLELVSYQKAADICAIHNHDVQRFDTETALYIALARDTYHGEWVIPPQDILLQLYSHAGDGAFKGTFKGDEYWSSTKVRSDDHSMVVYFSNGYEKRSLHKNMALSCRPVKLVEIAP